MIQTEKNFGIAAMKAGMDEKTARKYRKQGKLPSELKITHTWRTRRDPFEDRWPEIQSMLEINPGLFRGLIKFSRLSFILNHTKSSIIFGLILPAKVPLGSFLEPLLRSNMTFISDLVKIFESSICWIIGLQFLGSGESCIFERLKV